MKKIIFFLVLINSFLIIAQTNKESLIIKGTYDLQKIEKLKNKFYNDNERQKTIVNKFIANNNIEEYIFEKNGTIRQLIKITKDGFPLYYTTDNHQASISSRANKLRTGGVLGLNLNGEGMVVRVWDGGIVPPNHQELNLRVNQMDNSSYNSSHATHVTGTILASGIIPSAKGMAPQANAKIYDWNNDKAEALFEASEGAVLSNHSYGYYLNSSPSWFVGSYNSEAQAWDEICYAADYFLPVVSAGNDGIYSNDTPLQPGFDKLTGYKVSKNNLVVANAKDSYYTFGGFILGEINFSSSQGPADDGRIKPDITGNGTGVYSCTSSSNSSYATYSGTSMAAPNVTGSLALVQQHYNNNYNRFLRSSTLKALVTNTADDMGNIGPDPIYGWGYINAEACANAITQNGFTTWISEEILENGESSSFSIKASGNGVPLKISVVWTDPAGDWINDDLLIDNNTTPALINDLDVRVTDGINTYYPWRLSTNDISYALRDNDNLVDNVEGVFIDNPNPINYTVTISHKNNLKYDRQRYGIVITGIESNFRFSSENIEQTICSSSSTSAIYSFDYEQLDPGTTNFEATNLPNGMSASFDNNSISTNGQFNVTLGNFSDVLSGTYEIYIKGNDGLTSSQRSIFITVYHSEFDEITVISPSNFSQEELSNVTLKWIADTNAEEYLIELSTDINFNNLISNNISSTNELPVTDLNEGEVYFWRVFSSNRCNTSLHSNIFRFQVGKPDCYELIGNGTPILDNSITTESVEMINNVAIQNINITIDWEHSWMGDLNLTLISPSGSRVLLSGNDICSDQTQQHIMFSDLMPNQDCGIANSTYPNTNVFSPITPLSQLNDESPIGEWQLEINDKFSNDEGQLNSWKIDICKTESFVSPFLIRNNPIIISPNENHKYTSFYDLEVFTDNQDPIQQKFTIIKLPLYGMISLNGNDLSLGDSFSQEDINNGLFNYKNTSLDNSLNATNDKFIVDIENETFGWLPNQSIKISIDPSISKSFQEIKLFPNPNNGIISFTNAIYLNTNATIIDIRGRIISNHKDVFKTPKSVLNLNKISSGSYFIIIENSNNRIVKRFIVK